MNRDRSLALAIIASILASFAAFILVPEEAVSGELSRILYLHVPAAWICYLSFSLSLAGSILFLRTRRQSYDILAEAGAILGLVYGAVALITGAIWANSAWGLYWNWDPRETATLVLWIAYLGYISVKHSIGERGKRATIGAVYNILAFLTVPLSYASITLLPTLHPLVLSTAGLTLTLPIAGTLLLNVAAATILFGYFLGLFREIGDLEGRLEALHAASGGGDGA